MWLKNVFVCKWLTTLMPHQKRLRSNRHPNTISYKTRNLRKNPNWIKWYLKLFHARNKGPEIRLFQHLTSKKIKVMGGVKGRGNIVCPQYNRFTFFSFGFDRAYHSWLERVEIWAMFDREKTHHGFGISMHVYWDISDSTVYILIPCLT